MGQLPAQQTKVADHGLGPLKAGPTRLCVPVCNHDAASSKPSSVGRDVVDIHQQTMDAERIAHGSVHSIPFCFTYVPGMSLNSGSAAQRRASIQRGN